MLRPAMVRRVTSAAVRVREPEGDSMPKMKVHKGLKKRFRLTASKKVRYKASFAGHLMSGKDGNRRRGLRKPHFVQGPTAYKIRVALGA